MMTISGAITTKGLRIKAANTGTVSSTSATATLTPRTDLIALEENPLREQDSDPVERRSADRFHVLRSGFETVPATIRVIGIGSRTVQPMIVNLDTGFGVVFTGSVADGQELRFESDGRATLDGASVARLSFTFTGGVFADADAAERRDFVYGGAKFAVTHPIADGFDPDAVFPHADGLLEPATLVVGESRFAFFTREAH